MKCFVLAAGMLAGLSFVPASAADLSECAAMADDTERLACYDALAKTASPAATPQKEREQAAIRNETIDRCQTQTGVNQALHPGRVRDERLGHWRRPVPRPPPDAVLAHEALLVRVAELPLRGVVARGGS